MSSDDATIRRGVRNARYTTLPNHVLEDVRLSMEARWLLGYLLSKPDNWIVRMGDVAKKGGCGRDKARRMVNELVEHRYVEKEQERADGRFGKLSLVVYDEPREPHAAQAVAAEGEASGEQSVASLPQTEKPSTVKPAPVNASLVNTDQVASTDPEIEREGAREEAEKSADDPAKFEKRVKRLAERCPVPLKSTTWPGWANSSTDWAVEQFAKLTDAERAEAERLGPAYVGYCGMKALSIGTYFLERKWTSLPAELINPVQKPSAFYAAAFGPHWMAERLQELLGEPGPILPPSSFIARLIAEGGEKGERERLAHQARNGWRRVQDMHGTAANGKGVMLAPERFERADALAKLMEAVPVRGSVYMAWKAEHEARGWPWLPDPGGQPVVYFPAGGPAALGAFEVAVKYSPGERRDDAA